MNPRDQSLNKQLIGDSFFYLLTKIIPGLAGLLSVIVFLRWVGPDGYGQLTLILSFIMAVGALSAGWLNQSVLRYCSQDENKEEFSPAIFNGLLISILIGFIILLFSSQFLLEMDFLSFIISFIALASIILFRLKTVHHQANLNPKYVTRITAIQSILGFMIPLTILINVNHYLGILSGLALAYLFTSYRYLIGLNKSKIKTIFSPNILLKKYIDFGLPLSFRIALGLFIPFIDRWLIMFFYSESITGLYAGYSEIILRVFSIILFPITLAIHPRVTKLWNDDKKRESLALVRKGIWIQSGIFLLSFIIFYVFESQFFELSLFLIPDLNSDFKSLGIPLLIAGSLWQVSLLIHKPLELKENPIKMVWAIVFALAVAIIGNGIFLPKLGVIATAYSSIASASVYILMIIFFMMKANQFNK